MTFFGRTLVASLAVVLVAGSIAGAGSIYRNSRRPTTSIYTDDKAGDVGDLVTIRIDESHKTDAKADRKLGKSDKRDFEITNGDKLDILRGLDAATGKLFNLKHLNFSTDASADFDGKAEASNERSIEDEITVVVEDRLPNGNLVVVGKRVRQVEGEKHVVRISGILRPSDIAYDNTISSKRVANFHIVTTHTGQDNQFTQPGWLARVLNFISPF